MPASKCTCQNCYSSTRALPPRTPRPVTPESICAIWNERISEGPFDLYMAFALTAVTEFFDEQFDHMTDHEISRLLEAAQMAADVALRAANANPSWMDDYLAATAHLRQPEK